MTAGGVGLPPAGAGWHLRLLGDVVLTGPGGAPQRLPGRGATVLLARLALAPEGAQAREALVELLWPGIALDVGRNRLRQLLSTLKPLADAGGLLVQADRLWLRLRPGALDCDALRFQQALRAGRLADAAALYRGELLPGFYDGWIHDERQRLAALADALPPTLAPTVPPSPPAAATAVLNLPHYLTPVFGTELHRQQLRQAVQAHRLVTLLGPGGQGKTRLAVDLAHDLARPAAGAAPAFDLVAFVPLVACQGDSARPEAVLAALLLALQQAPREGDPLLQLQRTLGQRRSLLVLDNLEQLVDACAGLVAALLSCCPSLHLLATSRRALGLDGERLYPLPALPLPPAEAPTGVPDAPALARNPAVALFIDRARAARPDLPLAGPHLAAVRDLVRQLQGMPLAIELAAARARSLDAGTLLGLLRAGTSGAAGGTPALALLARQGPRHGADPRHASMLSVVQWSWALLTPAARRLLPQLAQLAGSVGLAQVQALADAPAVDTALALDELVAHSMLRSTADGQRYQLSELIREFAASQLPADEARQLRARQRRWLTGWFAALPPSVPLQQVRDEVPNLAAALQGAERDGADAEAAALAAAAQPILAGAISLPAPALSALQRCIERLPAPMDRALGLAGLARTLLSSGQAAQAGPLADEALALLPLVPPATDATPAAGLARAQVLTRVAHVRWRLHRDPAVPGWLDEALGLARAAGAAALEASILTNQGAVLRLRDPAASVALQRQAIAQWQRAGDRHGVNVGRCNLAIALSTRRAGCAEALALLALAAADTLDSGDHLQHAQARNLEGEAWSRLGDWTAAARAYRACIRSAWDVAEPWPLVYGLWNLPRALAHLRRPDAAARLMGFAEAHAPSVTGPFGRSDRLDLRRVRRLCARQLPGEVLAGHWQAGAQLPLAQAVAEALDGPAAG